MTKRVSHVPWEDPDYVVERAKAGHQPIRTYCLFSGGNDSMVTAHRCREHYDELVWIDTGTALPGVAEFVQEAADWIGKPLRVMRHDFDAFRSMVLEVTAPSQPAPFGFPGPAQHGRAYARLKERLIERLLRETKAGHPRSARVPSLTGIRRAESARRSKRKPITRRYSMVFCNPLIDWPNAAMRRYREEYRLPESPVAALLHRSGECNCGAFAAPGEREMIQSLWPAWFADRIEALEQEAHRLGVRCNRWGQRCDPKPSRDESGLLCSTCDFRRRQIDRQAA